MTKKQYMQKMILSFAAEYQKGHALKVCSSCLHLCKHDFDEFVRVEQMKASSVGSANQT